MKLSCLLLSMALPAAALAQAPGVAIEQPRDDEADAPVVAQALELKKKGQLLNLKQTTEQLRSASNACLALPPPNKHPLKTSDIYQLARQSRVRVGWFYLCRTCDQWHFNGAGGYPIARDGMVATCYHVVSGEEDRSAMREGYLLAADAEGQAYPVERVVAKSQTLDAVILHLPGLRLKPLPLSTNVVPGDAVYCYSDPLSLNGVFTEGIVNRFFWSRRPAGSGASWDDVKRLRLNVSCSWAPGSSGCAILDRCGNVIGHVSSWGVLVAEPEPAPRRGGGNPQGGAGEGRRASSRRRAEPVPGFQYYEAVPALGVSCLAQGPASKPARVQR